MLRSAVTEARAADAHAANAVAVPGRAHTRVCFHATGFGRFRGVAVNPTSQLIPLLPAAFAAAAAGARVERVELADAVVLEVACAPVDRALTHMHARAAGARTVEDAGDTMHVWLHFGVAASADHFSLEACGVNDATFCVPDEEGAQPRAQAIDTSRSVSHTLHTPLPVREMAQALREAGFITEPSTDAGRFLCNWCYYRSLSHVAGHADAVALFIHVPDFSVAPLPQLTAFATTAMLLIVEVLRTGTEAWIAARPAAVAGAREARSAAEAAALAAAKSGDVLVATCDKDGLRHTILAELSGMGFDASLCDAALAAVRASGAALTMEAVAEWAVSMLESNDGDVAHAVAAAASVTRSSSVPCTADSDAPPASAAGSALPADVMQAMLSDEPRYKLVVLVREDLNMGKGKIAAQVCHAALAAYRTGMRDADGKAALREWRAQGEPIVVLKCADYEALQAIQAAARGNGLPTHAVRDAGRTQVDPGTTTVLAIGPAAVHRIDDVTGSLKLL